MANCQSRLPADNGSELTSKSLDAWAVDRGVQLDFIRPGKPTENGFVEALNCRLRDECLNAEIFLSLDDAKAKIAVWKRDYNNRRPHSFLGNRTPRE